MQILHISADFPDPIAPNKTKAISNLLALTPSFAHKVYSINRINWPQDITACSFGEDHRALTYGAPPVGLFHKTYLSKLADWIIQDAKQRNLTPAIVHAHKLSVEALAGEKVAKALNARLIISSQGNSDTKIIPVKRDLHPDYKRIWHSAEIAFPFAPWTHDALNRLLGNRTKPTVPLPCPCNRDVILAPRDTDPVIRSAFNLNTYKLKNARLLVKAVVLAARDIPNIRLEIAGGGNDKSLAGMRQLVRKYGAGRVKLLGPIENTAMPSLLNQTGCFVLPSRRESFGMVFTEALLAGCPIIYPRGIAISGYFSDAPYAMQGSNSNSTQLARTIVTACNQQSSIKAALTKAHENNDLEFLKRKNIALTYADAIAAI